ncbi:MAG: endonuclease/exonuclease/phosphatase family protein [Clostridia bacterium]|nr:endonuclease/exonuclease/phosphatase family protein [Clostridia bacterium]
MKNIKKIISFIIVSLLLMSVVSCKKDDTPKETESTTKETTVATTTTADKKEEKKITIATYNIKNGNLVGYDFSILAEDILDSGAEIIGLQEVDMLTNRNQMQDTLEILSEETGFKYYAFAYAVPQDVGQYGNAILSKYPIIEHEVFDLSLKNGEGEKRVLLHAVIQIDDDTTMDFFVTHIESRSAILQFKDIDTQLEKCDSFILMGDFNQYPSSEAFTYLQNAYMLNTSDDEITHTTIDNYDFDNIVPHTSVKCVDPRTINTEHSDHYMLVADWIIQ